MLFQELLAGGELPETMQDSTPASATALVSLLALHRSWRAPACAAFFDTLVAWIADLLTILSHADLALRFVSYIRHARHITRVRQRNLLSRRKKARMACHWVVARLPVLVVGGAGVLALGGLGARWASIDYSDLIRGQISTHCHNMVSIQLAWVPALYSLLGGQENDRLLRRQNRAIMELVEKLNLRLRRLGLPELDMKQFDWNNKDNMNSNLIKSLFSVAECDSHEKLSLVQDRLCELLHHFRRRLLIRMAICFLLQIMMQFAARGLREYFWIQLTEGYITDKPFTAQDVLRKAQTYRRRALGLWFLAGAAFATVLAIKAFTTAK